jgi:hypothetical protein
MRTSASSLMESRKAAGHWQDKDNCHREALKYSARKEFKNNSQGAYKASRRFGWLDEICQHMTRQRIQQPRGYWDKERCLQEALLCSSRSELQNRSGSAYHFAWKNHWLDEICVHMEPRHTRTIVPKKDNHQEPTDNFIPPTQIDNTDETETQRRSTHKRKHNENTIAVSGFKKMQRQSKYYVLKVSTSRLFD